MCVCMCVCVPVSLQLCSYTLCEYFLAPLTSFFSTICSNTPMAWHYSWYLFRLRPPVSSSRFFPYIPGNPYVRTSFSGPCRCVWVSRLYSFDARNPAVIFVFLGGFGYTHLRGPVSRFRDTLFLTRDPKRGVGRWVGGSLSHVNATLLSLLSKFGESSLSFRRNCGTREFWLVHFCLRRTF